MQRINAAEKRYIQKYSGEKCQSVSKFLAVKSAEMIDISCLNLEEPREKT